MGTRTVRVFDFRNQWGTVKLMKLLVDSLPGFPKESECVIPPTLAGPATNARPRAPAASYRRYLPLLPANLVKHGEAELEAR